MVSDTSNHQPATTSMIDDQIAEQEARSMSSEEKALFDVAVTSISKEDAERFLQDPLDILLIIRGCANEANKREEIFKMIRSISEWRKKVGYYENLDQDMENDELFHHLWPEYICGVDKYGHFVQGIRAEEIDTDGLIKFDEEQLVRLQGQRMRAYAAYKRELSKGTGVQRYKHTALLDMKGASMSMLIGAKKALLRKILDVNSTFFPETMFKLYLVNAPLFFRAIWSVVKPWLHPVTVAKISILGGSKDVQLRKLEEEGLSAAQLPAWAGGTGRATTSLEVVRRMQAAHARPAAAAAAAAAAATPTDSASDAPPLPALMTA